MAKKWWILIGVAVVVVGLAVALPLVFLRGGPNTSTPQATVGSYISAMEHKDVDGVLACMYFASDEDRDAARSDMEYIFAMFNSIEISNLTVEVISQTDTTATVKASYHYKIVLNDGTVMEDDEPDDEYALVKGLDGQWLITGSPL